MSHAINCDAIHLLILSAHANLHENHLSMYVTTITVNIVYILIVMQSGILFFDDLYFEL